MTALISASRADFGRAAFRREPLCDLCHRVDQMRWFRRLQRGRKSIAPGNRALVHAGGAGGPWSMNVFVAAVSALTLSASVVPTTTKGSSKIKIMPSVITNAASECRWPTNFSSREYTGQLEHTSTTAQSSEDKNGRSTSRQPQSSASTTA